MCMVKNSLSKFKAKSNIVLRLVTHTLTTLDALCFLLSCCMGGVKLGINVHVLLHLLTF